MREHNYWAQFFKSGAPRMSGDQVYLLARSMVTETGISPMLFGAAGQAAQNIDSRIVDDVRSFPWPVARSEAPVGALVRQALARRV